MYICHNVETSLRDNLTFVWQMWLSYIISQLAVLFEIVMLGGYIMFGMLLAYLSWNMHFTNSNLLENSYNCEEKLYE